MYGNFMLLISVKKLFTCTKHASACDDLRVIQKAREFSSSYQNLVAATMLGITSSPLFNNGARAHRNFII